MNTMNDFNVRELNELPFSLPEDGATIYVLENDASFVKAAHNVERNIYASMDQSVAYCDYYINTLENIRHDDYNLVSVVRHPFVNLSTYLVAKVESADSLDLAIAMMMSMAETKVEGYYKELVNALSDEEYKELLQDVNQKKPCLILRIIRKFLVKKRRWHKRLLHKKARVKKSRLALKNGDETGEMVPIVFTSFLKPVVCCYGPSFSNNTSLLESLDNEEGYQVLMDLIKNHPDIRHMVNKKVSETPYCLEVRDDSNINGLYYNKTYFGLYAVDTKGNSTLLKFKHAESYCIYLMYMLSCKKNKFEKINLEHNEQAFVDIYKAVFNNIVDDKLDESARKAFREIFVRKNSDGSERFGRKTEYMKSIYNTIRSELKKSNIAYNICGERALNIPPDKIRFPDNLWNDLKKVEIL